MTIAKAGDKAPAFATIDDAENRVSLSDFKGKAVVLAFFYKARTSG